jgi:hypothetical protein
MNEKKHTYNSSTLALPPLKIVLGDVPNPEGEGRRSLSAMRPYGADKPEAETKGTLHKLIGHIQETK